MNHEAHVDRHSIANDFLTYGNLGIDLNRASERRARDMADRSTSATPGAATPLGSVRRLVGNLLIATGTALAGAVPSPSPEASKPGTV